MNDEKIKVHVEIEDIKLRLDATEGMLGEGVTKLETAINQRGLIYLDVRDVRALFKDCSSLKFEKMVMKNTEWNDACKVAAQGLLGQGNALILLEHGEGFSLTKYNEIMECFFEASENHNGEGPMFLFSDHLVPANGGDCIAYVWIGQ
ncbi:MAG: hypothetical protein HUK19_01860 [Fibrobacter sp.]|nr:hypothetical protein [Fibrobacter sp.]